MLLQTIRDCPATTYYINPNREYREDVMTCDESEEVMFKNAEFFLSTRAAEENVAGKIKLTEINSKTFNYQGYFFLRLICTADQAAKV